MAIIWLHNHFCAHWFSRLPPLAINLSRTSPQTVFSQSIFFNLISTNSLKVTYFLASLGYSFIPDALLSFAPLGLFILHKSMQMPPSPCSPSYFLPFSPKGCLWSGFTPLSSYLLPCGKGISVPVLFPPTSFRSPALPTSLWITHSLGERYVFSIFAKHRALSIIPSTIVKVALKIQITNVWPWKTQDRKEQTSENGLKKGKCL